MLLVEPGRAEGQLQTSMRGMVDRQGLGGQHRGMPVGGASDQEAQPYAGGEPAQRRERAHALEGLTRSLAEHGLEVIEAPCTVEAEILGEADPPDQLIPGHPLLRDIEPEPHVSPFSATNVATRLWKCQVPPSKWSRSS